MLLERKNMVKLLQLMFALAFSKSLLL